MSLGNNLPENTEALLIYLLVTAERGGRTYETLHKMPDTDEALAWLTENGFIYDYWGSIDLTLAGLQAARQIQTSASEGTRSVRETATIVPGPVSAVTFDTHPLRVRSEHSRLAIEKQVLLFMLAFDVPKNALPIPVLDGDILGRYEEADINLPSDDFVSGEHCRFSIKSADGHPTLFIEDMGSRNGTYVNKVRLEKQRVTKLEHGSRVAVGSTILIVVQIPR